MDFVLLKTTSKYTLLYYYIKLKKGYPMISFFFLIIGRMNKETAAVCWALVNRSQRSTWRGDKETITTPLKKKYLSKWLYKYLIKIIWGVLVFKLFVKGNIIFFI